mgnify:CR=1 FL=1
MIYQEIEFHPIQSFMPQRRIAIYLNRGKARDSQHARYLAFMSIREIAFRGCLRAMVNWLSQRDIPLSCKLRELAILPFRLCAFLMGRTERAALLEWRSAEWRHL